MNDYLFNFEKLEIWQKSMEISVEIYEITKRFPKEELFIASNQLRRSSSSIASNIAEGISRKSPKDRARFIEIAYSSTMETLNHLIFANKVKLITDEELTIFRTKISEQSNKLNAFHRSIVDQNKI